MREKAQQCQDDNRGNCEHLKMWKCEKHKEQHYYERLVSYERFLCNVLL